MSPTYDRSSSVLERPQQAPRDHGSCGNARAATRPAYQQSRVPPGDADARVPRGSRPVPRGWGSHEERRMARAGVTVFFLLGLYAALSVLLSALVWS